MKGTQNASHVSAFIGPRPSIACCTVTTSDFPSVYQYFHFLGDTLNATPIWPVPEQPIRVAIDNSSIFTPGSSTPQLGFRRSELIAQESESGNRTAFDAMLEGGTTAFHFSVYADENQPLNYTHEYQAVFIEPNDGSHVFDLQIGMCSDASSKKQNWKRD